MTMRHSPREPRYRYRGRPRDILFVVGAAAVTTACMVSSDFVGFRHSGSWVKLPRAPRGTAMNAVPMVLQKQYVQGLPEQVDVRGGGVVGFRASAQDHLRAPPRAESSVWVPMPSPQQTWAHSCCSRSKLQTSLSNPGITAIEADIRMGVLTTADGPRHDVAVMAHPPSRSSDLSFEEFLEACIKDGGRHLKLDFKDIESVEQCLPLVAAARSRLRANGQALWLNADLLPGPGAAMLFSPLQADRFLQLVQEHCPGAHLSLGWSVNPLGRACYTEDDCKAMGKLWKAHTARTSASGLLSGDVVFAVSLRLAERDTRHLVELLEDVEGSQLLFWTGTWEPAVRSSTLTRLRAALEKAGVRDRCGYDCKVSLTAGHVDRLFEKFVQAVASCIGRWTAVARPAEIAG
mmetsp:Transcript_46632/g.110883  ORF Transcript_46632/g.110883 Transcript_46632/m.110883 type:complete len:404 (+) Transcript_46632:39-1250(+)